MKKYSLILCTFFPYFNYVISSMEEYLLIELDSEETPMAGKDCI